MDLVEAGRLERGFDIHETLVERVLRLPETKADVGEAADQGVLFGGDKPALGAQFRSYEVSKLLVFVVGLRLVVKRGEIWVIGYGSGPVFSGFRGVFGETEAVTPGVERA